MAKMVLILDELLFSDPGHGQFLNDCSIWVNPLFWRTFPANISNHVYFPLKKSAPELLWLSLWGTWVVTESKNAFQVTAARDEAGWVWGWSVSGCPPVLYTVLSLWTLFHVCLNALPHLTLNCFIVELLPRNWLRSSSYLGAYLLFKRPSCESP